MNTREEIAWLARRAGWGLAPGELDELVDLGTAEVIDRLVDPDGAGVAPEPSPWAGIDYSDDPEARRTEGVATLAAWVEHLSSTRRPLENTLAWFWHDHFAVSYAVVSHLPTLVAHLDLLRERGSGRFAPLLREVTTDAAMLLFLDGATSTGDAPNENYGREMLELYALGLGDDAAPNYTEADVQAAANALTGWVVRRRLGYRVDFAPFRHDDSPQLLLGVEGVHDVDTVIDAVIAHEAVPGFIAGKLARFLSGAVDPTTLDGLTSGFAGADLDVAALARSILEVGVAGASVPTVLAPVPWMVQAMKATGARPEPRALLGQLRAMGQVPGNPPNVGGYPGASAWLASSATTARFTAANVLARLTPDDSPVLAASSSGAFDELADLLLRPAGFSPSTLTALRGVPASASARPGEAGLALALASPDLLIA